MKMQSSLWKFTLAALIGLMMVCIAPNSAAQADSPSDGRINQVLWVNSWGAVVVYCTDTHGTPSNSFLGGGIQILNQNGQSVLQATETQIDAARTLVNKTGHYALVSHSLIYSLYALPGDQFQINSLPDVEGKVRLGVWQDCLPVQYAVGSSPAAPAPPPMMMPMKPMM